MSSKKHKGTCQDAEQSPDLMINRLPDEVLLEVFDSYRQSFGDQYDCQWRKKYAWFNLAHVCKRWRAVMFASYSRLDLNIVVGPEKPGHIMTILSSDLPILIDYSLPSYGPLREITGSALWRMRAVLRQRDRVREIAFGGWDVDFLGKFISAANNPFPALESLVLRFPDGQEPHIPATFLRGLDQSDVSLRRLGLHGSLESISGLLLSMTTLTDLTLNVTSGTTQEPIIACLQGMQCLCSLVLTTPHIVGSELHSTLVPLLKLTRFHYSGPTMFLNNIISGLSAPSLRDARFSFGLVSPISHLSRLIDDVRGDFRSISVTFDFDRFYLVLSSQSVEINHFKPSCRFDVNGFPDSITTINSTPPTKLAMAEELALDFPRSNTTTLRQFFSLREFLRQFRSVRVLRVSPLSFVQQVVHLLQGGDHGEAILPLLEEIELSDGEEYQRRAAKAVADLKSFASARERTGRLVKVYHGGPA